MTAAEYSRVIAMEVSDRISEAVQDLFKYCEKHGQPLTREQAFAVSSMPLRVTLGLDETVCGMTETYEAIRRVRPEPSFPDTVEAWLRDQPSERSH